MIPNAMEIGNAGSAFFHSTSKKMVAVKPISTAIVQHTVVIQSYIAALAIRTL